MKSDPSAHPTRTPMSRPRQLLLALGLGTLLALACALAGPWLTPPAIARWTFQDMEQDQARAVLGLIGIRHLPLFLLAIAAGTLIFRLARSPAPRLVFTAALPYLLYVLIHAIRDSLSAGESAFSWVSYEPAYFIWPHFLSVPLGLGAAALRVWQQDARARAHRPP